MGIQIGDIFKDTEAFGDVIVVDVFISPTSGDRCYKVKCDDGMESYCEGDNLQTGH